MHTVLLHSGASCPAVWRISAALSTHYTGARTLALGALRRFEDFRVRLKCEQQTCGHNE